MIPSTHHTGYRDRLRAVFLLVQSHRPALRLRLDHLWSGDRPRVGVCAIGLVELLLTTACDEDIGALFYEELSGGQSYRGRTSSNHCYFPCSFSRFGQR